jgi:hypothetical protein
MDTLKTLVFSLFYFLLVLVVLTIGYHAYLISIRIYWIVLGYTKYRLNQLKKLIRSFFGKPKEIQSHFETIDWSDLEILSNSSQTQETAPPTSTEPKSDLPNLNPSCNKQKRDNRGRFTK